MKPTSTATATLRTHRLHSLMASGNLLNPANPLSLQITSQQVARGAGGRGEALRYIYTIYGLSSRNIWTHDIIFGLFSRNVLTDGPYIYIYIYIYNI